jgi:hypothetical protein
MKGLLKVLESFPVEAHSDLQFTQVSVYLRRHDVARAQNFEAAFDGGLQKEVGVAHILLRNVQVSHYVVDRDLHRMVVTPVVVKDSQSFAEVDISVLPIPIHEVRLYKDHEKLDSFSVEGTLSRVEGV